MASENEMSSSNEATEEMSEEYAIHNYFIHEETWNEYSRAFFEGLNSIVDDDSEPRSIFIYKHVGYAFAADFFTSYECFFCEDLSWRSKRTQEEWDFAQHLLATNDLYNSLLYRLPMISRTFGIIVLPTLPYYDRTGLADISRYGFVRIYIYTEKGIDVSIIKLALAASGHSLLNTAVFASANSLAYTYAQLALNTPIQPILDHYKVGYEFDFKGHFVSYSSDKLLHILFNELDSPQLTSEIVDIIMKPMIPKLVRIVALMTRKNVFINNHGLYTAQGYIKQSCESYSDIFTELTRLDMPFKAIAEGIKSEVYHRPKNQLYTPIFFPDAYIVPLTMCTDALVSCLSDSYLSPECVESLMPVHFQAHMRATKSYYLLKRLLSTLAGETTTTYRIIAHSDEGFRQAHQLRRMLESQFTREVLYFDKNTIKLDLRQYRVIIIPETIVDSECRWLFDALATISNIKHAYIVSEPHRFLGLIVRLYDPKVHMNHTKPNRENTYRKKRVLPLTAPTITLLGFPNGYEPGTATSLFLKEEYAFTKLLYDLKERLNTLRLDSYEEIHAFSSSEDTNPVESSQLLTPTVDLQEMSEPHNTNPLPATSPNVTTDKDGSSHEETCQSIETSQEDSF